MNPNACCVYAASATASSMPRNSMLREVSPRIRFSPLPLRMFTILRHVRACMQR